MEAGREEHPLVLVGGGDADLNRFSCEVVVCFISASLVVSQRVH